MAQAFSLLIQEEKQREFKSVGKMPMDSTSLTVNVANNIGKNMTTRPFKTNYQVNGYPGGNNNTGGNNSYTGNKLYAGNSSSRNASSSSTRSFLYFRQVNKSHIGLKDS